MTRITNFNLTRTRKNIFIYENILLTLTEGIKAISVKTVSHYRVIKEPYRLLTLFEAICSIFVGTKIMDKKLKDFKEVALKDFKDNILAVVEISKFLETTLANELKYYFLKPEVDTEEYVDIYTRFINDIKTNDNLLFKDTYFVKDEVLNNANELLNIYYRDINKLKSLMKS